MGGVSLSFLNSYVAAMALINAVHVACAHLDPKRSLTQLKPTDREYLSGSALVPRASRVQRRSDLNRSQPERRTVPPAFPKEGAIGAATLQL